MTIIATGIDLAKNIFAVHGVNVGGTVLSRQPRVARAKLGALIPALPPGFIGMAACSGAHYWARQFQSHGHTVRLMAPKLVTPYRMTGTRGKNDAADAAAICESMQLSPTAVMEPPMFGVLEPATGGQNGRLEGVTLG